MSWRLFKNRHLVSSVNFQWMKLCSITRHTVSFPWSSLAPIELTKRELNTFAQFLCQVLIRSPSGLQVWSAWSLWIWLLYLIQSETMNRHIQQIVHAQELSHNSKKLIFSCWLLAISGGGFVVLHFMKKGRPVAMATRPSFTFALKFTKVSHVILASKWHVNQIQR